jgi:biopolymer transport protein ExbD
VWIEIGTVEIKQSHGTDAAPSKKITYDLDLVYASNNKMNVNLKRNGKRVKTFKVAADDTKTFNQLLDNTIAKNVMNFKGKAIEIATATVTPRSTVNYGEMIQAFDVLRKNNIINIGVLSAKGN